MRIQFTKQYRCRLGHDHRPGDFCDLPDHVAVKLLGSGTAKAVREVPVERAVKAPFEHADKPAPAKAHKEEVHRATPRKKASE